MVNQKQKIIKSRGSDIILTDLNGDSFPARALIGRASEQFNNMLSLEAHRRAHFLPNTKVDSGYIVYDVTLQKQYICISTYRELIANKVSSVASHMLVCNSELTVGREEETADDRGRREKTSEVIKDHVKISLQINSQDLRLYLTGNHPDSEFIAFAQDFDVRLLDKIIVNNGLQSIPLRLVSFDRISYPGLVLLYLSSETR